MVSHAGNDGFLRSILFNTRENNSRLDNQLLRIQQPCIYCRIQARIAIRILGWLATDGRNRYAQLSFT